MQRATIAAVVAVGLAFAPVCGRGPRGSWSASILDRPRPVCRVPQALPTLVMVMSLLVLGGLALWELTAVREY